MVVFQLIHLDFSKYMIKRFVQGNNFTFFTNSTFPFFLFQIVVVTNFKTILNSNGDSEFSRLILFLILEGCVSYFFIKHKADIYTEKHILFYF